MKQIVGVIAGGGTGGHLYPGIAVIREFEKQIPGVSIHWVGSNQGLEQKIIPKENLPLHSLPVGGLLRTGRLAQLRTLFLMPFALLKSLWIVCTVRPDFVLGVGGFAAGPFVLVASFFVKATYIWEPNARPGFTNRVLSRFVKTAFIVFDAAKTSLRSSRFVSVGFPVRSDIRYQPRTASKPFRILVFGGSQGARAINNAVADAVIGAVTHPTMGASDWLSGVEIVHQTGPLDFSRISEMYHNASTKTSAAGAKITCLEYIDDMPTYYSWADLVVSRGGVGAVGEIITCRKASVIVPLPTAADNHQQANAEVLVAAQAGLMLLQRDLNAHSVGSLIQKFKSDPQLIESYEKNLAKLQKPSGAVTIVQEVLKSLKRDS